MGYYKDLRDALNSTKMQDKNSKEYKLIMEAKKPLLDILFYHVMNQLITMKEPNILIVNYFQI